VSAAATSRRRASNHSKSKRRENKIIIMILIIVTLSVTILVLQKPEVSPNELDEETRNEILLKQLKEQNPNSEVFKLEGGN
jgi:hypothetical protein